LNRELGRCDVRATAERTSCRYLWVPAAVSPVGTEAHLRQPQPSGGVSKAAVRRYTAANGDQAVSAGTSGGAAWDE
jgi:hypothetical protein